MAWILASISTILFLFNPFSVPISPGYVWGSFISFIKSLIWKDFTTALLQLNASLIPVMVGIFSYFELKKNNDIKLDKNLSILFIALFSFSLLVYAPIMGISEFNRFIQPIIYSVIFVIVILVWNKFEK
ncbi:MAG: hypothetical protein ACP5OA_05645 [Candidatus Woesearchaeota archaeon]